MLRVFVKSCDPTPKWFQTLIFFYLLLSFLFDNFSQSLSVIEQFSSNFDRKLLFVSLGVVWSCGLAVSKTMFSGNLFCGIYPRDTIYLDAVPQNQIQTFYGNSLFTITWSTPSKISEFSTTLLIADI
jgi:hypothetical protein